MSQFPKQQGHYGRRLYITPENETVAQKGFVAGGDLSVGNKGGSVVLPGNPAVVAVFDDFLGDLVGDEWNFDENDTGAVDISGAVAAGTNGIFRLAFVANSAPTPLNHGLINTGLFPQWKAKQGNLRFAARIKIDDLTGANVFAGFADTGAGQQPLYDTGDDAGVPLALSSSAVGFLYSGGAGSPSTAWRGVAVNADTVATPIAGADPTDNVYTVLEIEFGDTGAGGDGKIARFWQDGVLKGAISNPVPAARAMVPVVSAFKSESNAVNVDIDYLNISGNRDTGD
jgi:hypothetical protein